MPSVNRSSIARDVLAPANAMTILGAMLSFAGTLRMDTMGGFILVTVGRILDIFDGPVARRTHTSHFGAILDATADKLVGLAILIAGYHFRIVPTVFILLIFAYHLIVAVLNLLIEHRGKESRSTIDGKHTMFLHVTSLMLFTWANLTSGIEHTLLFWLGTIVLVVSGWFAFRSIQEYYAQFHATTRSTDKA